MALSPIIEYLLSRPRGNAMLLNQSISQTVIPAVPASTQYSFQQLPGTDFAAIIYESMVSPDVIPDAFSIVSQYAGNQYVGGIGDSTINGQTLNSFLIISHNLPAVMTLRNRTNVSQYYAGVVYFLSVKTEYVYKEVIEELERVSSQKMEPLASESNNLLSSLISKLGYPKPPFGGN